MPASSLSATPRHHSRPGNSPRFRFSSPFMHTQSMVRVGVDETLAPELLVDFPPEAEIVRIPRHPSSTYHVDFWILVFARRDAAETFSHLRGVKVVQSMMAGVDWIRPWLPKDITLCDGRG